MLDTNHDAFRKPCIYLKSIILIRNCVTHLTKGLNSCIQVFKQCLKLYKFDEKSVHTHTEQAWANIKKSFAKYKMRAELI